MTELHARLQFVSEAKTAAEFQIQVVTYIRHLAQQRRDARLGSDLKRFQKWCRDTAEAIDLIALAVEQVKLEPDKKS